MTTHHYATRLRWVGRTDDYETYDRTHTVESGAAPGLRLSADPAFRGDPALLNPEQLLVAAASSCQLLSFLALAARSGVVVLEYTDEGEALMPEDDRPVRLAEITLRPRITVSGADRAKVERLVAKAHDECYVANSLRTPVRVLAEVVVD